MTKMKREKHYIDELFADRGEGSAEIIPVFAGGEADLPFSTNEEVPDTLPILPIRGNVLFSGVLLPITAGRKKSIKLLKQAERNNSLIGVFAQKNDCEEPTRDDLYRMGAMARVLKVIELPGGNHFALLHGLNRIELLTIDSDTPYLMGRVKDRSDIEDNDLGSSAKSRLTQLRKKYTAVLKLSEMPNVGADVLKGMRNNANLINFIATHNTSSVEQKYKILVENSYSNRLNMVLELLDGILEAEEVKNEITNKTQKAMDKQQREYFLNQQMHVIQQELGGNPAEAEINEMMERAKEKSWNDATRNAFDKAISKLSHTPPSAAEYTVETNYINLLLDLPWDSYTKDNLNTDHARKVLDSDHFGLEKVKERIIEQIAVLKLKGDMKAPILCLVGPPGTGKTSLGKSIANALGRKYARVALGGLHDEAEIRGHRRTYVGAMPGRIIQNINKVQSSNPVFILDEIDKIQTNSYNGDPTSALLEVLDPEQNVAFHDNYLDLDYDLSNVMFIATANSLSSIQPALLDRMEIIDLSGYILEEKLQIASKYLVPRNLGNMGFKKGEVKFSKQVLTSIINDYTRESGVRQLDKAIAKILRRKAVQKASEGKAQPDVKCTDLKELLGLPIHQSERAGRTARVGVVTGLAWTQVGGEILFIEACTSKGKGNLSMTGNLGDVMKESATLAYEYLKANVESFGIEASALEESNIHIHVPEGATPKDGPSAGITMFVAMYSAFTHRKVLPHIAMTGEITLRGLVTPVGGIKEKILAAKRANITDIILCEDNRRDVEDINADYLQGLTFHYITEMREALDIALQQE